MAGFIAGYGGKVAPPYSRFYMGGEDDIRGFDFYTISPIAYIPSTATVPLYNTNGTPKVQPALASNGAVTSIPRTTNYPDLSVDRARRRYLRRVQSGIPHSHRRPGDAGAVC